jgi:hypothetical protein
MSKTILGDLVLHRSARRCRRACDIDQLYGHSKVRKNRPAFATFRRYIPWRNRHALDDELREVVKRANVA